MPAARHINPTLPLVAELTGRGSRVIYCATEQFRERIERAGAHFVAYPSDTIDAEAIATGTQSGSSVAIVRTILRASRTLVPFVLELIRREAPEAIMYDSNALWGRIAGAGAHLPKVSFMTTFFVGTDGYRRLQGREMLSTIPPMLPDLPAVLLERRRLGRRFDKSWFPPSPMFPMRGDLTLFGVPRALQAPDSRIDASCHFLGPLASPGSTAEVELDEELNGFLSDDRPSVYVSLGTLHRGSEAFFRTCFSVFATSGVRAVIACGPGVDPDDLGTPPQNVLVRTSVPQTSVLRRVNVFISHGGMNSVLESLSCGVPLVVVPQQIEQLLIGLAVEERGAAVVLRRGLTGRGITDTELAAAVERASLDEHCRAAADLGNEFVDPGAAAEAADLIEELIG